MRAIGIYWCFVTAAFCCYILSFMSALFSIYTFAFDFLFQVFWVSSASPSPSAAAVNWRRMVFFANPIHTSMYTKTKQKKQTKSSMRDYALAICRHHRKTRTKIRVHNIQQEIIVKEIKRLHPPLTSIPHRFRKVYILVFAGSCIAAGSLPNLFEIILSLLWCTPGFSFIHV